MMGRKSLSKESRVNILIVKLKVEKGDLSWKLRDWGGFRQSVFQETEMEERSLLMPLIVNLLECRSVKWLWQAPEKAEWVKVMTNYKKCQIFLHFKGLRSWWAIKSSERVSEVEFPRNFTLHPTETCVCEQKRNYQYLIPFQGRDSVVCKVFVQTFGFNSKTFD